MCRKLLLKTFVAVAAVWVLSACASGPKPLPRLAEDVRSSLGTVGIITVGPAVGGKGDEQSTLLAGAGGGAAGGGLVSLNCGAAAPICALLFVPAGALIGGISAARDAIPESTASEIQAALNRAIADRDLHADLRHGVSRYAGNAGEVVDLGAGEAEPVSLPDAYTAMDGSGVGSVLEMSVTQLVLAHKQQFHWGWGDSNPRLALIMTARARIIRVADQRVVWSTAEVKYESPVAQFSLWTAGDSAHLRTEIAKGSDLVARQIGDALFGAPSMARAESKNTPLFFSPALAVMAVGGGD